MHRSRAPSIAPGTFFVAQPWADCITNMPGFALGGGLSEAAPRFSLCTNLTAPLPAFRRG